MEKMRKCGSEELSAFWKQLHVAADEFQRKRDEKWRESYQNQQNETDNETDNDRKKENSSNFTDYTNNKNKTADEIFDKLKSEKISVSDLDSSLWSPYSL